MLYSSLCLDEWLYTVLPFAAKLHYIYAIIKNKSNKSKMVMNHQDKKLQVLIEYILYGINK